MCVKGLQVHDSYIYTFVRTEGHSSLFPQKKPEEQKKESTKERETREPERKERKRKKRLKVQRKTQRKGMVKRSSREEIKNHKSSRDTPVHFLSSLQRGSQRPGWRAHGVLLTAVRCSGQGVQTNLHSPCSHRRLIFLIIIIQSLQKTIMRHCLCYDMAQELGGGLIK